MRFWAPFIILLCLSMAASASTDIVGGIGQGFTGRWPLAGLIGTGTTPPPPSCTGTVDASEGCPLPMLGM